MYDQANHEQTNEPNMLTHTHTHEWYTVTNWRSEGLANTSVMTSIPENTDDFPVFPCDVNQSDIL